MRITSKLMKKAHKITREIKNKYKDIDYKFQLGLNIKFLLEEEEEMNNEVIVKVKEILKKVKATEKQSEKVINLFKKYNSTNPKLAWEECGIKEVRQRLQNKGLYTYKYGVEKNFLGKGQFKTKNLKIWNKYGKARIYIDIYIDSVLVRNNVYIEIY